MKYKRKQDCGLKRGTANNRSMIPGGVMGLFMCCLFVVEADLSPLKRGMWESSTDDVF